MSGNASEVEMTSTKTTQQRKSSAMKAIKRNSEEVEPLKNSDVATEIEPKSWEIVLIISNSQKEAFKSR